MRSSNYDVIVLGVGTMGAATCYALAKRGLRVLGLEQFEIVHSHGSHGAHTRLIRQSYFEHQDYVPLLKEASALWRALELDTGRQVYHEEGLLYCGDSKGEMLTGVKKSSIEHSIKLDEITSAAWLKRIVIDDDYSALWEPTAGFLNVEEAIHGFVAAAEAKGATIGQNQQVKSWELANGLVTVETNMGFYQADKLVITSGAWNNSYLQEIAPVQVTKQVLAWFIPDDPSCSLPCWCMDHPEGLGIYYGFPQDQYGFKIGHHYPGNPIDPDDLDAFVSEKEINELRAVLEQMMPAMQFRMNKTATCLYSMTSDGHFVLDLLPETNGQVCFAAGFSGHGFKFAPVIGEILADYATTGASQRPVEFLKASRF